MYVWFPGHIMYLSPSIFCTLAMKQRFLWVAIIAECDIWICHICQFIVFNVAEPFACKFTIEIYFTAIRAIYIYTGFFFLSHITSDFVYHFGANTYLCHKIHACTPSSTDIVYIYLSLLFFYLFFVCVMILIFKINSASLRKHVTLF